MLIPYSLINESLAHLGQPLWIWLLIAVTSVVGQGLCFVIWNHQINTVGTSKTSLFLYLQPVVTMTAGYLILGTQVVGSQLAGGLLIVIGVAVATLQVRKGNIATEA
jgi:drug/metabolite transporter (DMT)-like permease